VELELLEGRIYGARYYTVKPIFNLYESMTRGNVRPNWDDLTKWCEQTFGPQDLEGVWVPGCRWYANNSKFWFRNEIDRTVFVLKWQ
jgi:hypothetical protein